MAIPRTPYLPRPYRPALPTVALPKPPSLPQPGGSAASSYQKLQQQLDQRKEYFFDMNNKNQVNSIADVVVNTIANLWENAAGSKPLIDTIKQTVSDAGSLLYHGLYQPLTAKDENGNWDIDQGALAMNAFVNFVETADVLDNVYKGAVVDGKDGVRQAIFERRNYEFDTGNKVVDFMGEVLTPTNIFLLASTMGVGNAALAGAKAAGYTVAKSSADDVGKFIAPRLIKKFYRTYAGSADETLAAMSKAMNLTGNDIKALKEIATHSTNIKILSSLDTFNGIRSAVDVIDSIGPRAAFSSAILPLKALIQAGSKMTPAAYKYIENVYKAAVPQENVIPVLAKAPEIAYVLDVTTRAADISSVKIPPITMESILSATSKYDERALRRTMRQLRAQVKDEKLVRSAMDAHWRETGTILPFEDALKIHQINNIKVYDKALNDTAHQISGGMYDNFDAYYLAITKLYNLQSQGNGAGLESLYHMLNEIRSERAAVRFHGLRSKAAEAITEQVQRMKQAAAGVELDDRYIGNYNLLKQEYATLSQVIKYRPTPEAIAVRDRLNRIYNIRPNKEGVWVPHSAPKNINLIHRLFSLLDEAASAPNKIDFEKQVAAFNEWQRKYNIAKAKRPYVWGNARGWWRAMHRTPDNPYLVKRANDKLRALSRESRDFLTPAPFVAKRSKEDILIEINSTMRPDGHTVPFGTRISATELEHNPKLAEQYMDHLTTVTKATIEESKGILRMLTHIYKAGIDNALIREMDWFKALSERIIKVASDLNELRSNYVHLFRTGSKSTLAEKLNIELITENVAETMESMLVYLNKDMATPGLRESFENFFRDLYGSDNMAAGIDAAIERVRNKLAGTRRNSLKTELKRLVLTEDGTFSYDQAEAFIDTLKAIPNSFYENGALTEEWHHLLGADMGDAGTMVEVARVFQDNLDYLTRLFAEFRRLKKAEELSMDSFTELVDDMLMYMRELEHSLERIRLLNKDRTLDKVVQTGARVPDAVDLAKINATTPRTKDEQIAKDLQDMALTLDSRITKARVLQAAHNEAVAKGNIVDGNTRPKLLGDYILEGKTHRDAAFATLHENKTAYRGVYFDAQATLNRLENVLSQIQDIRNSLFSDPDIIIQYTENATRIYAPRLNSAYINMIVLQNPDVQNMLDMFASRDFDAGLNAIDVLAHLPMTRLREIGEAIKEANWNQLAQYGYSEADVPDLVALYDDALTLQEAGRTVMDTLEGMNSTRKLYGMIHENHNTLGEDLAAYLTDAVQQLHDMPALLTLYGDSMERRANMEKIYTTIESLMRAENRMSMRLEDWSKRLRNTEPGEVTKGVKEIFPTEDFAHSAIGDAAYTAAIYYDELGHQRYGIGLDFETSGKSIDYAVIHQAGVANPNTGVYNWYINCNVARTESFVDEIAMRVVYDKKGNLSMSYEDLKALVEDVHFSGDTDKAVQRLKDHYAIKDSPINIIPVKAGTPEETEELLLTMVHNDIKSQGSMYPDMRILTHNGKDYDIPLFNKRAQNLKGVRLSPAIVEDTQLLLQEKYGMRTLTKAEKDTIDDVISGYLAHRAGELSSSISRNNDMLANLHTFNDGGQFLPTIDKKFKDALRRIDDHFSIETKGKSRLANELPDIESLRTVKNKDYRGELTNLRTMLHSIYDQLDGLRAANDDLGDLRMIIDKESTTRLAEDSAWDGIHPILQARGNVMIDLGITNRIEGVARPILGVVKEHAPNLVLSLFGRQVTTEGIARKMAEFATKVQEHLSRIKNADLLKVYKDRVDGDAALQDFQQMQVAIIDAMKKIGRVTYFTEVYGQLRQTDSLFQQYAITYELWNRFTSVAREMNLGFDSTEYKALSAKLRAISDERSMDLFNAKRIMSYTSESNTAKAFKIDPMSEDTKVMLEYIRRYKEMIDPTMEEVMALRESTINVARIQKLQPVYEKLYAPFTIAEEWAHKIDRPEEAFVHFRPVVEFYNDAIGYEKLKSVTAYSPEEMVRYLWHWGKGRIMFNEADLVSANYFKNRGRVHNHDVLNSNQAALNWAKVLENQKDYEAMGIGILRDKRGNVMLYLKEDNIDMYRDLPFLELKTDFEMGPAIATYALHHEDNFLKDNDLEEVVSELLYATDDARRHMLTLAPDAVSSTMEKLDPAVLRAIDEQLISMPSDMIKLETLMRHSRFEGNLFNHSILGSIDVRREWMPFASFNPGKTMFHAAELMHNRIDVQLQFTMLLQNQHMAVETMLENMTKDELFQYLKNAPHLKLGFLQKHKTMGYKLSQAIVNSPKDLEFAAKAGAIILDRDTYVKAYSIINRNAVPEGFWKWIDKTLVFPFKFGWLAWNYGTAFRNLVDSSAKNVAATGDLRILKDTVFMTGQYFKYKSVLNEITKLSDLRKLSPERAADMYFSSESPGISREMYDLITEFKRSGASSGMTKEMQRHYGDAIDKLYRRIDEEFSGLSPQEFRDLMYMDDDAARGFLIRHFGSASERTEQILRLKADLYYYKRAYAMFKHYKGQDLNVDILVRYLKRADNGYVPEEHRQIYQELLEKTKDFELKETLMQKVTSHPVFDNAMMWNAGIEEVTRLSMYRYLREEGNTMSEATAKLIDTHFDYGHKSQLMMYLEMLMPFSTFRFNSLLFWTEYLGKSPQLLEFIADYWRTAADVDEYRIEDIMLRRGVQYQMMTGNIVLDRDTGFTMKVTPSIMDTMAFYADPAGYLIGSLHSAGQTVYDYLSAEPYNGETQEEYQDRKARMAWQLVPFVGSHVARVMKDPDKSPVVKLLLGPLFNATWTEEQREVTPYVRRKYLYPRRTYGRSKRFRFRYKRYPLYNKMYYQTQYKFRYRNPSVKQSMRTVGWVYQERLSRSISGKGKNKWAMMGFPTNKWTLKLKIILTRNLTRHIR